MFKMKVIRIPSAGWWVGMVSSKDILLKCRTNVNRYSSAGVGGLYVGILALCKVCFIKVPQYITNEGKMRSKNCLL